MVRQIPIPLPYKYQPRSYHRRIYAAWQRGVKQFMIVIHRRGGKTKGLLNLVPMAMVQRKGNYAHVFPELKLGRDIVWDGIDHAGMRYREHFPAPLIRQENKSELKITFHDVQHPQQAGSTYAIYGTDRNIDALVGSNSVGIIWDEWSLQNPQARDLSRPILVENGGWEMVCCTPRGENHAHDLFQYAVEHPDTWHTEYLTVDDTRKDAIGEDGGPVISHEKIAKEREEMQARGVQGADALIEQEYWLSWKAPMPGAYWGDALMLAREQKRIGRFPYDPTKRVYTAWDLGTSKAHDTNSIWFVQLHEFRVCVIDYHQASNKGAAYYAAMLDKKGYAYAKHFAMEGDLEEADWGSGKTRGEVLHDLGYTFTPVPKLSLVDGIDAGRTLIARCYFDDELTRVGVHGLSSFRREYDQANRVYRDYPVHDYASHPASAWRYLAIGLAGEQPPATPPAPDEDEGILFGSSGRGRAYGWMG